VAHNIQYVAQFITILNTRSKCVLTMDTDNVCKSQKHVHTAATTDHGGLVVSQNSAAAATTTAATTTTTTTTKEWSQSWEKNSRTFQGLSSMFSLPIPAMLTNLPQ